MTDWRDTVKPKIISELHSPFQSRHVADDILDLVVAALEGKAVQQGKVISNDGQVVVEVRWAWSEDDPPIRIFRTNMTGLPGGWPETFGSREQLQAYLRGLKTALNMTGYWAPDLEWNLPELWQEPSWIRWTVRRDAIMQREELNSAGEVIRI